MIERKGVRERKESEGESACEKGGRGARREGRVRVRASNDACDVAL